MLVYYSEKYSALEFEIKTNYNDKNIIYLF